MIKTRENNEKAKKVLQIMFFQCSTEAESS